MTRFASSAMHNLSSNSTGNGPTHVHREVDVQCASRSRVSGLLWSPYGI